jgi:hypothetical protein
LAIRIFKERSENKLFPQIGDKNIPRTRRDFKLKQGSLSTHHNREEHVEDELQKDILPGQYTSR